MECQIFLPPPFMEIFIIIRIQVSYAHPHPSSFREQSLSSSICPPQQLVYPCPTSPQPLLFVPSPFVYFPTGCLSTPPPGCPSPPSCPYPLDVRQTDRHYGYLYTGIDNFLKFNPCPLVFLFIINCKHRYLCQSVTPSSFKLNMSG